MGKAELVNTANSLQLTLKSILWSSECSQLCAPVKILIDISYLLASLTDFSFLRVIKYLSVRPEATSVLFGFISSTKRISFLVFIFTYLVRLFFQEPEFGHKVFNRL